MGVRTIGKLVKVEEWLLILFMTILCLLTFGNVLSRYIFNTSFAFTEELTTNLFVFIIFIGAALLAREGRHLGFALITDLLPNRLKVISYFIEGILTTFFFIILLWYGIRMVIQQYDYGQMTPAMGIPAWLMGLAVPLGAFLCIFRFWEGYIIKMKSLKEEEK